MPAPTVTGCVLKVKCAAFVKGKYVSLCVCVRVCMHYTVCTLYTFMEICMVCTHVFHTTSSCGCHLTHFTSWVCSWRTLTHSKSSPSFRTAIKQRTWYITLAVIPHSCSLIIGTKCQVVIHKAFYIVKVLEILLYTRWVECKCNPCKIDTIESGAWLTETYQYLLI